MINGFCNHVYHYLTTGYKANLECLICFSLLRSMKPLAAARFCVVFCLLLETSCGYNETELEDLRDLWFDAIRKTNESLLTKNIYNDDFHHLIDKLSTVKTSAKQFDFLQEVKGAMIQNSYERIFGFKIGIFTNFCGPGNISDTTVCGFFNGVDECCKSHDSCEHAIITDADYAGYPSLPSKKSRFFTSLDCDCDVAFYNCLKRTKSVFGDIMLSIYSVAQASCFQRNFKVVKCTKYDR